MTEFGTFKHGGVVYPLPAQTVNPLLKDADPSLYYVLDYFRSVLSSYMGVRMLAEAQKAPVIGNISVATPFVVPYDPTPFLNEQQFKFPLLAVYRKKDKFIWKTIAFDDDSSEWCVDFVLPPLNGGQMERLSPILRTVGVILQNRIENTYDPFYQKGLKVWETAGLEEIYIDEATYGQYAGTGNLVFPAWRGKLIVKEIDGQAGVLAGLDYLTSINTAVSVMDAKDGPVNLANLQFVATTPDFLSGFAMQITTFSLQVPLVTAAPNNVSESERIGTFFPGSLTIQASGTFTGTWAIDGSADGTNWTDLTTSFYNMSTGVTLVGGVTVAGMFTTSNSAVPPYFRIRCTVAATGAPVFAVSGII